MGKLRVFFFFKFSRIIKEYIYLSLGTMESYFLSSSNFHFKMVTFQGRIFPSNLKIYLCLRLYFLDRSRTLKSPKNRANRSPIIIIHNSSTPLSSRPQRQTRSANYTLTGLISKIPPSGNNRQSSRFRSRLKKEKKGKRRRKKKKGKKNELLRRRRRRSSPAETILL